MNKLSDEILNKYIDGELDYSELKNVNEILAASAEDKKRLDVLLSLHTKLKNITAENVSEGFTEALMKKLLSRKKSQREQKNFVLVISSIFAAAILVVVGMVVYSAFSQGSDSQTSVSYSKHLVTFFQSLSSMITQMFTSRGISIFGSILSLGVLISGYYFFENLKASKQNLSK